MILLQLMIILREFFSKLLIEHFGKKSNLNSFHMQKRLNILPNDDDVIKVVKFLSAVDQESQADVI